MKCIDYFNTNAFLKILNNDEKEIIVNNSTIVNYAKGDLVVKENEYITNTVFIGNGYVKVYLEFKRRSIILNILGPGKFAALGQMTILEKQPFSITAIDEVTICLTDIKYIREVAQRNSKFALYILELSNQNILDYVKHNLVSLTQNNIHGRLANILIFLAESVFENTTFDLMLTRQELSQFCNISRENVIKILYEFNSDGLIHLKGKKIHIHSIENLRRIASHG